MGKVNRGKVLRDEHPDAKRGACPITGRAGVKLLYECEVNGEKMMVSKHGQATVRNRKRRAAIAERAAKNASQKEKASATENAAGESPKNAGEQPENEQ